MARRKTARKSYARKPARKSYARKAAPKRRTAKRKSAKRSSGGQRITLVIQQAPVATPNLVQPATKAAPARARFGG